MTETITSTTHETIASPELQETLEARAHLAFANKINGAVYGSKRIELQAAYEAVEEAYLADVHNTFISGVEKFDESDAHTDLEQLVNSKFHDDLAARKTALLEAGGRKARFMDWYANTTKAKRIAATAGLAASGAVLATVGSGVGLAAAVVGSGVAGWRLGKGYLTRASQVFKDDEKPVQFTSDTELSAEENAEKAVAFIREQFQSKIEQAEKTKKRAIVGAVGSVAIGATAAFAIKEGVEAISETETGQKAISYLIEKKDNWLEAFSGFSLFPQAYAETVSPSASELSDNLLTDELSTETPEVSTESTDALLTDELSEPSSDTVPVETSHDSGALVTDDLESNDPAPSNTETPAGQSSDLLTDQTPGDEVVDDTDPRLVTDDLSEPVDTADTQESRLLTDELTDSDTSYLDAGSGTEQPASPYTADAMTVERGEGLYQTFKEMGIPQSEWKKTLNASGKGLVKIGEAYYDSDAKEYRLKYGDGKLSLKALNHIASTHTELYPKARPLVIPRGMIK